MIFANGSEFIPNLILIDVEAQKYAYTEEVLERLSAYDPECIVVDTEEYAKQILKEKKKKNHLYLYEDDLLKNNTFFP
jgi:hypothetical protein